jgi:DNA repair exonuclease SbcCD nuclease subunit
MILFSDLHLKESNEDLCFEVLERICEEATQDDWMVVCCGDFWHLRYQVNVRLLNRVKAWLDHWTGKGMEFHFLPGNHDQVNVGGRNALEVLGNGDQVMVWTEPGWWAWKPPNGPPSRVIAFVPYRKDPVDQARALEYAAGPVEGQGEPKVIFGHFGVIGATMNSGKKDQEGIVAAVKPRLFLGHYHKPHEVRLGKLGGVIYVGAPFQHNFGEAGNQGGYIKIRWDRGIRWERFPLGLGPQHHIVLWDPRMEIEPSRWLGGPDDKVRLDIVAPVNRLDDPDLVKRVKASGYEEAQINVLPQPAEREQRFEVEAGESLEQSAERFLDTRLRDQDHREDVPKYLAPLKRWAGAA